MFYCKAVHMFFQYQLLIFRSNVETFITLLGCCVYEKPKQFGESSSESEGEDDDEGCGSAHCILGHGRGGHGQMDGHGARPPQSSGGSNAH